MNLYDKFVKTALISYDITMFVPILSGVYLFTALYFIRKYKRNEVQVNIKAMALHATSFALYMVSLSLYLYVDVKSIYFKEVPYKTYLTSLGVTYLCSSLSQAILCIILWDLGKKRERQQRQELPENTQKIVKVEEEEDDEAWIKRKKANKIPITEE